MRQLGGDDRRLYRVQPEVSAYHLMEVLRPSAVATQQRQPVSSHGIVRQDQTGISYGTEIL